MYNNPKLLGNLQIIVSGVSGFSCHTLWIKIIWHSVKYREMFWHSIKWTKTPLYVHVCMCVHAVLPQLPVSLEAILWASGQLKLKIRPQFVLIWQKMFISPFKEFKEKVITEKQVNNIKKKSGSGKGGGKAMLQQTFWKS